MPAAELDRMMEVRRAALARFGENAIRRGAPMATIEEALVPLYLHHRYQVEAAASVLGGQHYIYAMRGDGRDADAARLGGRAAARRSTRCCATLDAAELRLPERCSQRSRRGRRATGRTASCSRATPA